MMGKKKQAMKRGGKVVSRAMGGPMKAKKKMAGGGSAMKAKKKMAGGGAAMRGKKKMAGGGMMNVSPRKALAMGAKPMKGGGKVMKGKKKKVKKAKKRG